MTERESLPQEPDGMLMSGLVKETVSNGEPQAEYQSVMLALAELVPLKM